ncbi:MAG: adenylosuccinate lyase [Thermodesulfobacteriota bacterium]|nr:adenylosuccinate lyase [Thermodesulfobacteriota bacterium]
MIPRYTRPRMARIWSDQNRYQKWLDVEIAVCEAWAGLGKIPKDALKNIKGKANFDIKRIEEIESVTRHDVIAFVTCVGEYVGDDARFIHMGLTSSDVLDTAYALLLRESSDVLVEDIKDLMASIKKLAFKYKDAPMMGRSHGIHAEPTTFGLKLALWYSEMERALDRMYAARDVISCGKISGAVGTFAHTPPDVEEYVCKKLGIKPAPVSTQIIQRDRHAQFFTTLAIIASSIEKFAVEIRHLQRTEVSEVMEPFAKGQKGSSAMPHKKNPVLSENITGLARLLRGYALSAMEDIALWHERDISHSSVERVIGPDATSLIDFALNRFKGIMDGLSVYPENMKKNIDLTKGLWHSGRVLLALVEEGIQRDKAYVWVQRNALAVWEGRASFKDLIERDKDITAVLSQERIDSLFEISQYLAYVDTIMKRVFNE